MIDAHAVLAIQKPPPDNPANASLHEYDKTHPLPTYTSYTSNLIPLSSPSHLAHQNHQLLSMHFLSFLGFPVALAEGTGLGSTQISPKNTLEVHSSSSFVFVFVTVAKVEEGNAGGEVME